MRDVRFVNNFTTTSSLLQLRSLAAAIPPSARIMMVWSTRSRDYASPDSSTSNAQRKRTTTTSPRRIQEEEEEMVPAGEVQDDQGVHVDVPAPDEEPNGHGQQVSIELGFFTERMYLESGFFTVA